MAERTTRGTRTWASADHRVRRIVELVVVRVQEHRLLPVQVLLARLQQSRDVEPRPEQINVLHQLDPRVLGVQDGQLRVDPLTSPRPSPPKAA